jgi:uncharacterized protein (DUF1697 family)
VRINPGQSAHVEFEFTAKNLCRRAYSGQDRSRDAGAAEQIELGRETEMTAYIALLRAVNVGGTGKLPMTELAAMCEAAGFEKVKTYIASGNVVFTSGKSEAAVKAAIEAAMEKYAGKPVGVMVRTAAEMAAVRDGNPFADAPGNRVVATFLDEAPPKDAIAQATNVNGEEMALGKREIYIRYTDHGMADSKLKIPAAKSGTARNMNTVAKLAEMAGKL